MKSETVSEELVLVISAERSSRLYWADLWRYRELLFFLSWRDIAVRYKQTILGLAWSAIRPFITMVIFTLIFGKIAKLPTEGGAPYPILVFAALLPWQFFAGAVVAVGNSIVVSSYLITKIYFPRILIPIASIGANLVDLLVSVIILAGIMLWYNFLPPLQVLLLPLPLLLAILLTLGFGILTSALSVRYRDVRIVLPFLVQLGFFISPIGFSSSIIPLKWRWLYDLNPMVAIIESSRWCLIPGATPPAATTLLLGIVTTFVLLFAGIAYFRATERTFADMI